MYFTVAHKHYHRALRPNLTTKPFIELCNAKKLLKRKSHPKLTTLLSVTIKATDIRNKNTCNIAASKTVNIVTNEVERESDEGKSKRTCKKESERIEPVIIDLFDFHISC